MSDNLNYLKLRNILKKYVTGSVLPFWKSNVDNFLDKINNTHNVLGILNQIKIFSSDEQLKPKLIAATLEWANITKEHIFQAISYPEEIVKLALAANPDEKISLNTQVLISKIKDGSKEQLVSSARELMFLLLIQPMTKEKIERFVNSIPAVEEKLAIKPK